MYVGGCRFDSIRFYLLALTLVLLDDDQLPCAVFPWSFNSSSSSSMAELVRFWAAFPSSPSPPAEGQNAKDSSRKGAERLPPGIAVSESDLHLRRLWGDPRQVSILFSFLFQIHIVTD
jgi:hypothetical protein